MPSRRSNPLSLLECAWAVFRAQQCHQLLKFPSVSSLNCCEDWNRWKIEESVLKRMPFNAVFKESKFAKGLLQLPLQDSINPGWWICFLAAASSRWTAVWPNDLSTNKTSPSNNIAPSAGLQWVHSFGVMASSHPPSWPCLSCMDLDSTASNLRDWKHSKQELLSPSTHRLETLTCKSCNLPRNNG